MPTPRRRQRHADRGPAIARRTVGIHVSRIYRKTGVSARAALAALMAGRPSGRPSDHPFTG
ncbi:hypothetical protein [Streptomyces antibioticus]|uniref:hypothetical protein n=1 Tax=Streptomyces antibioticus TaxID=1890 RepID=UPI0033CF83B7